MREAAAVPIAFQGIELCSDTLRLGQKSKSILSLVLFGSRARGDHKANSDTDLLLITDESFPRNRSVSTVSLSFYPYEHLLSKANHGDLFVCHLVKEGKPIADGAGFFERIRQQFRFRDNYVDDITKASRLAWFLIRHSQHLTKPDLINRRIAWCVRTILIAHSAEARTPVFSAEGLETFAKSPLVRPLIEIKCANVVNRDCFTMLEDFLERWGTSEGAPNCVQPGEFLRQFKRENNLVALQTIRDGWAHDVGMYV